MENYTITITVEELKKLIAVETRFNNIKKLLKKTENNYIDKDILEIWFDIDEEEKA